MNKFEEYLTRFLGEKQLKKIQSVKIGIAGAGGLGSNCAFNLVRSGFKKFKIYDFDFVEARNLSRQFYFINQIGKSKVEALKENLLKINPDLEIDIYNERITENNAGGIFFDCNVIVEAFDDAVFKRMLAEIYSRSGKLFVSASGLAGCGNSDEIVVRKVHDTFYLIGDFKSEVTCAMQLCSPRVSIAAAKQADVILDWVLNHEKP